MKQLAFILLFATLALPSIAQQPTTAPSQSSAAAAQPHLDIPKNIRPYFVAFLVRNDNSEKHLPLELAQKHLAYIRSQVEAKKYVVVGPMTDDGRIAGMAIIDAKTAEEAKAIAEGDPAVKAGRFTIELHPAMYANIAEGAKY